MKGKKFRRAVEAEVERRRLFEPVTVRTLSICFKDRTVDISGRVIRTESDCLAIPILSTEQVVLPRDGGQVL